MIWLLRVHVHVFGIPAHASGVQLRRQNMEDEVSLKSN